MEPRWRIELFGGLRAVRGETVVTRFRTQNSALLLAHLALSGAGGRRRQCSLLRDELANKLWPESDPRAGRTSLRHALMLLRRALEPEGVPPGAVLVADRTTVRLNPDAVTTDVAEFEAAVQAADQAPNHKERTRCLARAVDLYQGELLAGYYEPWVLEEQGWLTERYFGALAQLLALLEQASELGAAVEYARRGVHADPLREEAHRDLMRLLAAVGQPAAALRQYEELERLFKEEIGATPEPATRALVREIERLAILRSQASTLHPPTSSPRHALAPGEGENRLVTLLFADMSRSLETTRDLHPEAGEPRGGREADSGGGRAPGAALVNRLLQAMIGVVLRYEGRIDRFQGDGVLAVFGVPQAHEDDPERAIRAALDIRAAAHHLELEVTAGINTGQVYMGAVGSERHQEVTVMGPAVGLAARLQEQAQPGQILVGEATQRLTRRAFGFSASTVGIQGLAPPVPVYRVEQALARPEKTRGMEGRRAALIGREEELAKLQTALRRVLEGQGQLVTLIGEAGVGKSRLVAELKSEGMRDEGRGMRKGDLPSSLIPHPSSLLWLEGRCLELNMTTGYSLFLDLLRDYFGWRAEEPEGERVARLVAALRERVDRGDLAAERAEEMGPLLGNLFSLRSGTDWDLRLKNASPEQIRHQTLVALQEYFAALARRQPVVLVLEDLHWADPLSLDLISRLMETLSQAPLLLLCVYRPEREHRCWQLATIASHKCPEGTTELPLRELTPPQSRRLVASLLSSEPLPDALTEGILQQAQGNPFFLEEVIQAQIDAGTLYRERAVWRVREGKEEATVPASVQSVILSRLDRLERNVRLVLESASVMGRLFRRRLLEQIAAPEGGMERGLWELEERGLIYQERVVPEEEYSFQHVLTQETVYGSLLPRQRQALHQQVGEAIESLYAEELAEQYEQLAYHYERSEAEEKAVEYLLKAGEKARRAYVNEAAIGYFQRALERLGSSQSKIQNPKSKMEGRLAALHGLARLYQSVGRIAEAEESFRQAISLGPVVGLSASERARLYHGLGSVLFIGKGGDDEGFEEVYDEVVRLGEEALALLGPQAETLEAALILELLASGYLALGRIEPYRALLSRAARFIDRLPYGDELYSVYLRLIPWAQEEKNLELATRLVEDLERKAAQHHDLRSLGHARFNAAGLRRRTGDGQGAFSLYEQSLALFRRAEEVVLESTTLGLLSSLTLDLGDLAGAAAYAGQSLRAAEGLASPPRMAFAYAQIGRAARCRGDRGQARDAARKALQSLERREEEQWRNWEIVVHVAALLMAVGDREPARRLLQKVALGLRRATLQLHSTYRYQRALVHCLCLLEQVYADPEAYRAFCRRIQEAHPELDHGPFTHWWLEPAEPDFGLWILDFGLPASTHEIQNPKCLDLELPASTHEIQNPKSKIQNAGWVWHDPFGDCSWTVADGLVLQAANERDLELVNRSAPRLVRPITGEFTAAAVCVPATAEQPAIGGLLLWQDAGNYLRLDWGTRGPHEIGFQGCLGDQDLMVGRGCLPAERIWLRLEGSGDRVSAFCSADGESWFTVGSVAFPLAGLLEVGVHAIGRINRSYYPGAYPEGTAIRFESFQLSAL